MKKKVYKTTHLVTSESASEFIDKVSEIIKQWQGEDFEVEVQYSINNSLFTALLFKYYYI